MTFWTFFWYECGTLSILYMLKLIIHVIIGE